MDTVVTGLEVQWGMFICVLQKEMYPVHDYQLKTMWYICSKECYSAVKNNGIMKFAGKGMEIEKKIIPSETIQTQKDKHNMQSLLYGYQL